jgi:hypothetical protein
MSDFIDKLEEALSTEFKDNPKVSFSTSIPNTFSPPQVIVTPGDPFLTNATAGTILENWDVLAVVSMVDRKSGVKKMREIDLRIRRAASTVGATWEQASGPQLPSETDRANVLSVNRLHHRYEPQEQLPGGS